METCQEAMKFPTAVEDSVNHKNGRDTKIFLNRNDEFYGLLLATDFLDEDSKISPNDLKWH